MKTSRIRLGDIVGIPLHDTTKEYPIGHEETWDIGVVQDIRLGMLHLSSTVNAHSIGEKISVKVNGMWCTLSNVRTFDNEERAYIEMNTTERAH